ncbi:MAG: phosphoserine phosphatase SerB [Pseudolabrys sp.]|nr:phosphoserine phosphatase SerB [Pseudolabrys sp.]
MSVIGTHVATLIAPALDSEAIERAEAILPDPARPEWLAGRIAADIPFSADGAFDQRGLTGRLRATLPDVDVVVQPSANRKKKLFLADMDSTMIEQECIDELAGYAGVKPQIAAITERAMRGEIEFEPALRQRVALLKGLPVSVVDEIIDKRITLMPGAKPLIATMKANGCYTCLVSGGFTLFTARIAKMIGFDETRSNRLVIEDGKLAGSVEEPIFGRTSKVDTLIELRDNRGLPREDTMAIGDGANDLDMIVLAGLGVAYHAKPKVAAAAATRIDHNDLTALLYVQGYGEDELVLS